MNNIIQTIRHTARAAAVLLIALLAAQTAGAQGLELKPCKITFDISSGGTVKLGDRSVTNGKTIDCTIPSSDVLTITPETGYVVSSVTVTHDATVGLSIDLKQKDDFHWSLDINPYGGSDTPTITVHIVFDKGLAGGADEALAVALTADDDLSHLTGGWYKVESDLTFGHTVNLHGDTHITIATGATLTVSTSDEYGFSGSALTVSGEGTLNISASYRTINVDNYTQTGCAVTLSGSYYGLHAMNDVSISGGSLTTSGASYGIDTNIGSITISGGTVSASGDSAGLFATLAMNITGGTVNASSNNYGIRGYSVSITGGQVTASSGGISSNYGDITLGCTSATDYITASGYVLQNDGFYVKIADGQTLYGGGFPSASLIGTIGDPSALNGLMLRPTAAVTKSGTNEYTIWNAAGWDAFCDRLAADGGKAFFSGKTVKLGADIGSADNPITRRAGSADHDFTGQFNGQGHTLYVRLGTAEAPHDTKAAPFQNVTTVNSVAASIENLHVCGDIYASGKYAAGIIGSQYGNVTLRNCRSSVNIHSSAADDTSSGGLVGNGHDNLTIEGCLFDGSLTAEAADVIKCAGFVGYNSGTLTVSNSLVAPASVTIGTGTSGAISATFARGWSGTPANSYYTAPPSGGWGATQGKQARTIAAGEGVTISHAGEATIYDVSHITAYKASEASGDDDPFIAGLLYNNNVVDVLYAGSDDAVSLTLSNTATGAPEGYQYGGYTASAGTLSGSTLTMPDEDVTVSVDTEVLAPIDWTTVSSGDSEADPYIIYNKDQLNLLAQRVNSGSGDDDAASGYEGKYFELGGDITYSHGASEGGNFKENYEAIGGYFDSQDRCFQGHFDGKGHTISGIRIRKESSEFGEFLALFGNVGSSAVIQGVHLTDARIKGQSCIGGIVGNNYKGTVSGCTVTNSVITAYKNGGFICGNNNGGTLSHNYYYACTANGTAASVGNGCSGNDVTDDDGAVTMPTLSDTGDNTRAITTLAKRGKDDLPTVVLEGRTLYKDGDWNTLCLPFDVEIAGSVLDGDGVDVRYLYSSEFSDGTLTLTFSEAGDVSYIEPGEPYIIKWSKPDGYVPYADPATDAEAYAVWLAADTDKRDIHDPVFTGVTIPDDYTSADAIAIALDDASSKTSYADFIGTYSPIVWESENNSVLFLGSGNTLYFPQPSGSEKPHVNAFRGYFQLKGLTASEVSLARMNFDEQGTQTIIGHTEITEITERADAAWYSLDGVKLDSKPSSKGIYIHGNKKVVVE